MEEWALAHQALSKLRLKRAGLDAEEGAGLLRAFRAATHAYFGYASFGEYIERLFGLRRRAIEDKVRVAQALEELPELAGALRSGELNWSAVRELSRVAVPETEREWIAVARERTAREVERMVSGLAPGNRPADRRRPEFVRHVLRFEVGAETLATFREAMKELRKSSDQRLDDDAALLLMAREVLGGPGDAGRASYQVAVLVCEDCGRGFQHATGELIQIDPAIVEMCHCDAQRIPIANLHDVTAKADARVGTTDSAQADALRGADEIAKAEADVGTIEIAKAEADVGTIEIAKAETDVGTIEIAKAETHLNTAESARADAWPGPRPSGARAEVKRRRATQDTPPAIRREVFWRDRGRCVVPGCRNATYVDLHHLDPRSEGGSNDPDNLVALCGAHHRALHRGRLRIDGKVSTGLRVRHADGTAYGCVPSPRLVERQCQGIRRASEPRVL